MIPGNLLAIDGDGTAIFVAPVDIVAVNKESGGAGDVDTFADTHVKADFFGDIS